jgi:hypothetical protein
VVVDVAGGIVVVMNIMKKGQPLILMLYESNSGSGPNPPRCLSPVIIVRSQSMIVK